MNIYRSIHKRVICFRNIITLNTRKFYSRKTFEVHNLHLFQT